MAFENIVGNESAKKLLRHTLDTGRIGHAYIFEGQRGTGRLSMARAFAAAILKTDKPESHPDFTIVTNQLYDPSKKQQNVLVDTIRGMKKDVYIKPYSGEKKIYVIPKADTMQAPAQNSILKVFEEPPEYCVIILLAENTNAFLPTIMSRATLVRLNPPEIKDTAAYLSSLPGISTEKAQGLAVMSGGIIGKALELAEDNEAAELRDRAFERFGAMTFGSIQSMYGFVRFMKQNKAEVSFIFEVLTSCFSDLLHMRYCGEEYEIKNTDKKELLRKISGRLTRRSVTELNEALIKYKNLTVQNVNYPAAMLCMAMEYWEAIHDRDSRS